jgi:hypothetical protein
MGKRSDFVRVERDYYPTPEAAVLPLLPHLPYGSMFIEPCAGDGRLVRHLEKHGMSCSDMFDIEPQHPDVQKFDALGDDAWLRLTEPSADFILTNPPWDRKVFHPMIETFRRAKPTWLLHDANWLFTKQAGPYLPYIRKIVAIGRVKWIEDSKMTGKDDAVWSLHVDTEDTTEFYGRTP